MATSTGRSSRAMVAETTSVALSITVRLFAVLSRTTVFPLAVRIFEAPGAANVLVVGVSFFASSRFTELDSWFVTNTRLLNPVGGGVLDVELDDPQPMTVASAAIQTTET